MFSLQNLNHIRNHVHCSDSRKLAEGLEFVETVAEH